VFGSDIFQYALGGATICLVGVITVLASMCRKIPSAFSESKWIMLAVYTLCGLAAGFVCVALVAELEVNNPTTYLYAVTLSADMTVTSFLFFMFIPKFHAVMSRQVLEVGDITRKIDKDRNERAGACSSGMGRASDERTNELSTREPSERSARERGEHRREKRARPSEPTPREKQARVERTPAREASPTPASVELAEEIGRGWLR
jgi:hypothetical protein